MTSSLLEMKKTTIFSLSITILFIQWQSITVESADTSEAKVTGAKQGTDNPFFTVMQDVDAKSGWTIEPKKVISRSENENNLFVFFYTRSDSKADFKEAYGAQLCPLLRAKANVLFKEAIDMIFPAQKGSCEFKNQKCPKAIRASAQVHADNKDNGGVLPEKTPFQLEVRVLNRNQANNPDNGDNLFKVSFDIGGDINHK